MSRLAQALVVVAFVAGAARAQTVTVGVHGGVNLARIGADETVDSAYLAKPVAGGSVDLYLASSLALRVEVEYAQRGGKITVATTSGEMETEFTLSYLALPVNLRYDVGSGTTTAYIFAGATLAALIAASQQQEDGTRMDVRDHLRPVDVSIDLGGGIGYHLSPPLAIVCDFRYSLGLVQLARDAELATKSWKSRDIKIVLGMTYTFGAR